MSVGRDFKIGYHDGWEDAEKKWKARVAELEDRIKAEVGALLSSTGLFGRDEAAQVQEYARRVQATAERLEHALKGKSLDD